MNPGPGMMRAAQAHGIAVASACSDCAWVIPGAKESAPGFVMGLIHDHEVPELEQLGWIVTRYAHQPADVSCPHYGSGPPD
jgi:hypothetical protein